MNLNKNFQREKISAQTLDSKCINRYPSHPGSSTLWNPHNPYCVMVVSLPHFARPSGVAFPCLTV